jgi:hypothetical protein
MTRLTWKLKYYLMHIKWLCTHHISMNEEEQVPQRRSSLYESNSELFGKPNTYKYIYIHIYIYISIPMHVHTHIFIHIYMYIYIHINIYTYIYIIFVHTYHYKRLFYNSSSGWCTDPPKGSYCFGLPGDGLRPNILKLSNSTYIFI